MILSRNSSRKENWSILLGFKVGVVKEAGSSTWRGYEDGAGILVMAFYLIWTLVTWVCLKRIIDLYAYMYIFSVGIFQ